VEIINIHKAKTHFSKLLSRVHSGEEIIIAKNNLPLVELVIHKPKSKIVFGLLADKNPDPLDDHIMEETEELNDLFYQDHET